MYIGFFHQQSNYLNITCLMMGNGSQNLSCFNTCSSSWKDLEQLQSTFKQNEQVQESLRPIWIKPGLCFPIFPLLGLWVIIGPGRIPPFHVLNSSSMSTITSKSFISFIQMDKATNLHSWQLPSLKLTPENWWKMIHFLLGQKFQGRTRC